MKNTQRSIEGIDFVGIGFQRCATSWLNFMLYEHPEICKPKSGLHFFNKNYNKGKNWYIRSILESCKNRNGEIKLGEFSTTYSYPEHHNVVFNRISRDFPNIKILINIRNPIERAQSEYFRLIKRQEIKKIGFKRAIKKNQKLLKEVIMLKLYKII